MLSIIRIEIKLACLRIERKDDMENQFMRADEVARELEVSRSYAYRLIQQLNAAVLQGAPVRGAGCEGGDTECLSTRMTRTGPGTS